MPDVYTIFANAWTKRVTLGSSFASEIAKARSLMLADPDYDYDKHLAALFAAEETVNADS